MTKDKDRDQGQRYEVRERSRVEGSLIVGWTSDLPEAIDMMNDHLQVPGVQCVSIFDRFKGANFITRYAGVNGNYV